MTGFDIRFAVVVTALASLAAAQQTWIVDNRGGPGVHFRDMPSAVAASTDGDTILIRPGDGVTPYAMPGSFAKALTIRGDSPQPVLIGGISFIEDIPAGQTFVFENLHLETLGSLGARRCAGQVVLSRFSTNPANAGQPRFFSCANVILQDCTVTKRPAPTSLVLDRVRATFVRCQVLGIADGTGFYPTMVVQDSVLDLVDTVVRGGDVINSCQWPTQSADIAIHLRRSSLWLRGTSDVRGGRDLGCGGAHGAAILGTFPIPDPIVKDPLATIGPRVADVTILDAELTHVVPGAAVPGTTQVVGAFGPTNSIVALFASLPTGYAPIPTGFGDVWIAPGAAVHVGTRPVDAARHAAFAVRVPPVVPDGLTLIYQGVSLSPSGAWQIGAPGVAVVR